VGKQLISLNSKRVNNPQDVADINQIVQSPNINQRNQDEQMEDHKESSVVTGSNPSCNTADQNNQVG
jgi:hypothetical protein